LLAALAVVSAAILSLLGAALTLALIGHGQRAMVCLREVVK
jgi:hypothetical protein